MADEPQQQPEKAEPEKAADAGEDAPDLSKPHPLEQGWTLWFDNPSGRGNKQSTWGQTLRSVYTFRTVEEFWWCVNAAASAPIAPIAAAAQAAALRSRALGFLWRARPAAAAGGACDRQRRRGGFEPGRASARACHRDGTGRASASFQPPPSPPCRPGLVASRRVSRATPACMSATARTAVPRARERERAAARRGAARCRPSLRYSLPSPCTRYTELTRPAPAIASPLPLRPRLRVTRIAAPSRISLAAAQPVQQHCSAEPPRCRR